MKSFKLTITSAAVALSLALSNVVSAEEITHEADVVIVGGGGAGRDF